MGPVDLSPIEAFWQEDPFNLIRFNEVEALGIDPADIPQGTFAARKHPSHLPSRFGGNAYGSGFFEFYDRLDPRDMKNLQTISLKDPESVRKHYKEINQIYKKFGLLIRFSNKGKPYYLIPDQLISTSLAHLRNKAQAIGRIIDFHRKKYLKEGLKIGLLTHSDDLIINDLTLRFKEHDFTILGSLEMLRFVNATLDLIILTRDIYEIIRTEKFSPVPNEIFTRKHFEEYALHILGKVYNILKADGEIFIIANQYPLKTSQIGKITFKTIQEQKNFLLFSRIFKTKKKYRSKSGSLEVNIFDFQKYLSDLYVEKDVVDKLLGQRDLKKIPLEEMDNLPFLNYPLDDMPIHGQLKSWPKVLSIYFKLIFLRPMIPESIKDEWRKRFTTRGFSPNYMITCLGQKRPLQTTISELREDIMESRLAGCPLALVADYRDSFDYLVQTLDVLSKIKSGPYAGVPDIYMERLRDPLENKKRRFAGLNDVLKLMSKVTRLEKIQNYLNPNRVEGARTSVLTHMETLPFFGFSYGELKEIFLIIVGHTAMGRILSGKMNQKTLKPVSDLARTYDPQTALNLLRYCRLMSMAETVASKKADMNQEQLAELFDLFDSLVKVVINQDMDWDKLMDEKISSMGGVHNKIIRKILKMMDHFQFLNSWAELGQKGEMEKEALVDYDERELSKIENVIRLIEIIERFENQFLKDDPLQIPIFYRKFLNMEFHGTGRIFENMDSQIVFILLWIAVNASKGEIINFNPIVAQVEPEEIKGRVRKVEKEVKNINIDYLDLATLIQFSQELYENYSSFIIGTGFQFRVNHETRDLEIHYVDLDEHIEKLETLTQKVLGQKIPEIPIEDFSALEKLFAHLESFYQSHLRLINQRDKGLKLPARQKRWFRKIDNLKESLKTNFRRMLFKPESVYTDIEKLNRHCYALLKSILPEFMDLENLKLPGRVSLESPILDYIFASIRKIQALINRDRANFQDMSLMHRLARREFGPMDAGTLGVSENQIEQLETIIASIRHNPSLHEAIIKSFIFRDTGLVEEFRKKYREHFNQSDHAQAGALFLEKEKIPARYYTDLKANDYLISLVRYHDFLHHIIRGEFSLYALKEILDFGDKELFDGFFVSSFVMISSMREDLILEDLATQLLKLRKICHKIIDGKITLDEYLNEIYTQRSQLYYALEEYIQKGLPEKTLPARYLESWHGDGSVAEHDITMGREIFAMERIFRLREIRYVVFRDLANFIVKVPLKYIYKKRKYYGVGYATFEKELYEALRVYNSFKILPEKVRHFILENMVDDRLRIFGYEYVSSYLSYDNLIKLLMIALVGSKAFWDKNQPLSLNFLDLAEKIDKRYETVNDWINNLNLDHIWRERDHLSHYFKGKTGIQLKWDDFQRVLSIDFIDSVNISQKVSYMESITDLEQLKNYYHYSLRSLRKNPFYTDDYELALEKAFEKRLKEITGFILDQAKRQMEFQEDFKETHHLIADLNERALEIGFTDEQKHRLNDLYELKKDSLKREKLEEIVRTLEVISDMDELRDYWDSIKWYLLNNRIFLGKEFEFLIAKNFDEAMMRIQKQRL
ncbi:MAG: hypothetical protein V1930_08655 [Pseudomonadota bacterium]